MHHSAFPVSVPVITVFNCGHCYSHKPKHLITADSFVSIETDGSDCEIYFTTDGQPPNLSSLHRDEVERTFKYRGPFQLRPGRRTVMAVSFNRSLRKQSLIAIQQFDVIGRHGSSNHGNSVNVDGVDELVKQYGMWESNTSRSNDSSLTWKHPHHIRKQQITDVLQRSQTFEKNPQWCSDSLYGSDDRSSMDLEDWSQDNIDVDDVNYPTAACVSSRRYYSLSPADCHNVHSASWCHDLASRHEHCCVGKTGCTTRLAHGQEKARAKTGERHDCRYLDQSRKIGHYFFEQRRSPGEQSAVGHDVSSQKDDQKVKQSSDSSRSRSSSRSSSDRNSSRSSKTSRSSSSSSSSSSKSSNSSSSNSSHASNLLSSNSDKEDKQDEKKKKKKQKDDRHIKEDKEKDHTEKKKDGNQ